MNPKTELERVLRMWGEPVTFSDGTAETSGFGMFTRLYDGAPEENVPLHCALGIVRQPLYTVMACAEEFVQSPTEILRGGVRYTIVSGAYDEASCCYQLTVKEETNGSV